MVDQWDLLMDQMYGIKEIKDTRMGPRFTTWVKG